MPTVLVTTTGEDRPGITAGLLEVLSASSAEVLDMEQVVIRGQLTLGLVTRFGDDQPVLKDLLFFGYQAGVDIHFEPIEDDEDRTDPHQSRYVVTIIGHTLSAAVFKAVADAIAGHGANIDRIVRLSTYPVRSYEFEVSGGDQDDMRRSLLEVARTHHVDVAVQGMGLERRAKRIVVLDMDSTLIQDEVIDLLAEEAGVEERVKDITARAKPVEASDTTIPQDIFDRLPPLMKRYVQLYEQTCRYWHPNFALAGSIATIATAAITPSATAIGTLIKTSANSATNIRSAVTRSDLRCRVGTSRAAPPASDPAAPAARRGRSGHHRSGSPTG